MDTYQYTDVLTHYGILGQKWGVRRYQNPDGSLTSEGKARYRTGDTRTTRQNAEDDYNYFDKQQAKVSSRISYLTQYLGDMEMQGLMLNGSEKPEDWPEKRRQKYEAIKTEREGCEAFGEILQNNKQYIMEELSDQGIVGAAYETVREGRTVAEQIASSLIGLTPVVYLGSNLKTYDSQDEYDFDRNSEISKQNIRTKRKTLVGVRQIPTFGRGIGNAFSNMKPNDTITGIKEQKKSWEQFDKRHELEKNFIKNKPLVRRIANASAKAAFKRNPDLINEYDGWQDLAAKLYKDAFSENESGFSYTRQQLFWDYMIGIDGKKFKGGPELYREIYGKQPNFDTKVG